MRDCRRPEAVRRLFATAPVMGLGAAAAAAVPVMHRLASAMPVPHPRTRHPSVSAELLPAAAEPWQWRPPPGEPSRRSRTLGRTRMLDAPGRTSILDLQIGQPCGPALRAFPTPNDCNGWRCRGNTWRHYRPQCSPCRAQARIPLCGKIRNIRESSRIPFSPGSCQLKSDKAINCQCVCVVFRISKAPPIVLRFTISHPPYDDF